jgi:endonuclease-3
MTADGELIREITERLEQVYGQAEWRPHGLPVEELVGCILSQHTSDVNSTRAFAALQERYPEWRQIIDAPTEEVAKTIRSGGMPNQKARRIQEVLRLLQNETGEVSLDALSSMTDEEARRYLMSLPGVGPKTAAIVLCFSLGRPVIAVDTHVFRVAWRLGLIEKRIGEARAHDVLQSLTPKEIVYRFHMALIRHGRAVCKAPVPRCGQCVLTDICRYYQTLKNQNPQFEKEEPLR